MSYEWAVLRRRGGERGEVVIIGEFADEESARRHLDYLVEVQGPALLRQSQVDPSHPEKRYRATAILDTEYALIRRPVTSWTRLSVWTRVTPVPDVEYTVGGRTEGGDDDYDHEDLGSR